MRKHAETKKNKDKIEKDDHFLKSSLRNCLCVLAGTVVLTIGIMAPKTIFAMIDKNEVDHIYVQQADTSYLDSAAQMTMEEKLDLLDWKSTATHVSNTYPVETIEMYNDSDLYMKVVSQLEQMQKEDILPQFDFDFYDMNVDTQYETLVNLENMNQYLMLEYMVFQVSDDYMYVSVDMETGKILGYTVYAYMTETEWQDFLNADAAKYMAENLGVSEDVIIRKYNYGVYNESYGDGYSMNGNGKLVADENMEISAHVGNERQFVDVGMWVDQEVPSDGILYDDGNYYDEGDANGVIP